MVEWQSLFSSAISMKASPLKVVSVFVGDAGDGGVLSSVNVSPVMVRGGVIARQKGKRDPHGSEEVTKRRWASFLRTMKNHSSRH